MLSFTWYFPPKWLLNPISKHFIEHIEALILKIELSLLTISKYEPPNHIEPTCLKFHIKPALIQTDLYFTAWLVSMIAWLISPLYTLKSTFTPSRVALAGTAHYYNCGKAKSLLGSVHCVLISYLHYYHIRQAKLNIRSVSEKAMLSHEAGRHFILNFTIKQGKYSVLVMRQRVVFQFICWK